MLPTEIAQQVKDGGFPQDIKPFQWWWVFDDDGKWKLTGGAQDTVLKFYKYRLLSPSADAIMANSKYPIKVEYSAPDWYTATITIDGNENLFSAPTMDRAVADAWLYGNVQYPAGDY